MICKLLNDVKLENDGIIKAGSLVYCVEETVSTYLCDTGKYKFIAKKDRVRTLYKEEEMDIITLINKL